MAETQRGIHVAPISVEELSAFTQVRCEIEVLRFGTEVLAEVTGRSRRMIRKTGSDGVDRLAVENRAGSANLAESQAFMDDAKRILVFSDTGGTGCVSACHRDPIRLPK